MRIFQSVREEYETSLVNGEEVVAGIPAYVLRPTSYILSPFIASPVFFYPPQSILRCPRVFLLDMGSGW